MPPKLLRRSRRSGTIPPTTEQRRWCMSGGKLQLQMEQMLHILALMAWPSSMCGYACTCILEFAPLRYPAHVEFSRELGSLHRHHVQAEFKLEQVLDGAMFQQGSTAGWRCATIRLRAQSMLDINQWRAAPLSLIGLTLRGNATAASDGVSTSIPASHPSFTCNGRVDIDAFDFGMGQQKVAENLVDSAAGNSQDGSTPRRPWLRKFPPASGTVSRLLDNETLLSVDAHVNRPMAHARGWEQVGHLELWTISIRFSKPCCSR
jgi:hypothetical protein